MHRINRRGFTLLLKNQKISLVITFWLATVCLLLILNKQPDIRVTSALTDQQQSVSSEKNQMGRCSFRITNPTDKQSLGFVSFDNLQTSCADAGLFKTATLRKMEITRLQINLPESPASLSDSNNESISSSTDHIQSLLQKYCLQPFNQQEFPQVTLPDFSHLAKVQIDGFQCRFMTRQNISLNIESKKAFLDATTDKHIHLFGNVLLQTPSATLRANHVYWNIQNLAFEIKGFYMIQNGREQQTGRDGLFDRSLHKKEISTLLAYQGETRP